MRGSLTRSWTDGSGERWCGATTGVAARSARGRDGHRASMPGGALARQTVMPARLLPHRVEAAVDVDDLARRRREPVGEQRRAGPCRGHRVVDVPAEGGPLRPGVLELLEPGDRLGGRGADRTGRDEVAAHLAGAEVPGEV